jgi:hypothetical protein
MRLRELINDEEYLTEKRKLLDNKIRVEESLKAMDGGLNNVHDQTARTFKFAHDALERFESGAPEIKKSIMREVGSNFFLRDKTLSIDVVKPFQLIQEALDTLSTENRGLELSKKRPLLLDYRFRALNFLSGAGYRDRTGILTLAMSCTAIILIPRFLCLSDCKHF